MGVLPGEDFVAGDEPLFYEGFGSLETENEIPYPGAGAERQAKKRKHQRKVEALKAAPYEVTPAQRLMRREMTESPFHPDDEDPVTAGKAVDAVLGVSKAAPEVQALALEIIHALEPGTLALGFKEWAVVQGMIEAGILAGYDRGSEDAGSARG